MDYDLVVIGGGPAGIYAAKNAASNGLKTILIEGNKFLGGQPANLYPQKTIYDIPNYDSVNSLDFVNALAKELSATNCTIKLDSFVVSFEQKGILYEVKTNNNFVVQATNILVCTGLGIFTPNEIMFDDENIHYSVKDINLYKNKKIVILGGGNSAVD
jgi:thioredoxin reductase (NADPH)